jgi:hypothetical protein
MEEFLMKKRWLIESLLALMVILLVTMVVFGDETSPWYGPYGSNSPGVFYRYIKQNSAATDYDCVQFENRNTNRVQIDYVTVKYPNTGQTLWLNGGETEDPPAAIVQGDRVKTIRVTP